MADAPSSDSAWREILAAYPDILSTVTRGGVYAIASETIRRFREPRLMTKHDTSTSVPAPLRELGLNVLSTSRRTYAIGDFALFERFPDAVGLSPTPCARARAMP